MPQEASRGGQDDAAEEEVKTFHTEGDGEERAAENGQAVVPDGYGSCLNPDDLNDVKSSLVIEGDPSSLKGANSQRNKRLNSGEHFGDPSKDGHKKIRHDGDKMDYPRFPPYTNFAFFPGSYPATNGAVITGPGGSKVPMVHPMTPYPPSLAHLMYNGDRYPPGTPPPAHLPAAVEIDSKTGILRPRHSLEVNPFHPLSPSSLGQLPPHLEVYNVPLQGQHCYPSIRSPYPPNLMVSSSGISRLAPSGLPHPSNHHISFRGIPMSPQSSPGSQHQDTQQQSNDREKDKERKSAAEKKAQKAHIKKPLNAFMLYMKEMRASVVKECTLKESAAINQILGRRWHALSREEQAKYYELARKERQLHMQLYPGWSARDNYATSSKKRKKRKDKAQGDASDPSTPKKCRARFGVDQQQYWCKPCRRKKKCIRFISDDNDGLMEDDSDSDDLSNDENDQKDICLGASENAPISPEHSREHNKLAECTRHQSENNPSPGSVSFSVASLTSTQRPRSIPPTLSGSTSSQNSNSHILSQPIISHSSPGMLSIPHSATPPSHPPLSSPSTPFMLFSAHSPLLSHHSPSSLSDSYRGPPVLTNLSPHGLLPAHPPKSSPLSLSIRRLPNSEMPQDLSVKSETVTA